MIPVRTQIDVLIKGYSSWSLLKVPCCGVSGGRDPSHASLTLQWMQSHAEKRGPHMPIHTKMTVDWQGLDGSTFRKLPWNFFFLIQPPNTLLPSHPIVSSPFTPVSSALSQSLLSDHSIQVQDSFFCVGG